MDLLCRIARTGRVPAIVNLIAAGGLIVAAVAGFHRAEPPKSHAQLFSPGPLSSDHAELDGDAHCDDCHESGRGVGTNLCFECHQDLAARVRARQGLHGREYRGRNCGTCHVEHLGRSAVLVRWPGGSKERFDHSETGWDLNGAHARVECDDCHDNRNQRGHATFIGEATRCNACHQDPHDGRFGTRCETCHNETAWNQVRIANDFDHSATRFPLVGEHQNVECAECHGTPARYDDMRFASCSNCHEDPHEGRFQPRECDTCHVETGWDDVAMVRHNHPWLSLANGHRRTPCADCHDRGLDVSPSRGPACVQCHARVHEADFGLNCRNCHATIEWEGLRRSISLSAHDQTPFPLHGMHVEVPCGQCHDPQLDRETRWRGLTFDNCRTCHSPDPHEGEFATREEGECSNCHDDEGFRPSHFGISLHATTDFALDGRHVAVPCSGCHELAAPRLDWRVTPHECASCHENPHGDQFAAEMADGGCAHCHSTSGWEQPRIDHSIWPLTGEHALIPCESCHTPTDEDRRLGRGASYLGVPRECEGCHDDIHAGQFRLSDPNRPCTDCHETETFEISEFAHAAKTGYPIEGAHAELECEACHRAETLRNGDQVVRYRLGYSECADCHANPHAGAN